jgi:hypothetical protein
MAKKKAAGLVPKFDDGSLSLQGFASLAVSDQEIVVNNHRALLVLRHRNRYEMGERLSRIQKILKPLRLYELYLKTELDESRATANRAVAYYERIQALPASVRQVVVERSLKLSPKRLEAFPPPDTDDRAEIESWLTIQQSGGQQIEIQTPDDTPDVMIRQNLRDIRRNLRKIPKRLRGYYADQLCGMVLTLAGMSAKRIEPLHVPENIFAMGRPRLSPPTDD